MANTSEFNDDHTRAVALKVAQINGQLEATGTSSTSRPSTCRTNTFCSMTRTNALVPSASGVWWMPDASVCLE